ncbi:MAG: malate dehydrogenase [Candidatus Margulisiibacteriota bacterium]
MTKISVIGAGNVGAETARRCAEKGLGEVILVDIIDGVPQGKALDILESAPVEGFACKVTGTNDYSRIKGSDIVVVTAGLARKPGMTREDLVIKNAAIIKAVAGNIKAFAPNSIVIVVTNPLDVMTQLMKEETGFDSRKVVGMAGILDSARLASFIWLETGISPNRIEAMVLGGHGDAMVPLPKYTLVDGKPVEKVLPAEKVAALIQRTRDGGAEIVKLLKTGSAYYAPSASAASMVEAIVKDTKKVVPCSAYLEGQYCISGVYIGVPVRLGKKGIEEIIELELSEAEENALNASAQVVKDTFKLCGK